MSKQSAAKQSAGRVFQKAPDGNWIFYVSFFIHTRIGHYFHQPNPAPDIGTNELTFLFSSSFL